MRPLCVPILLLAATVGCQCTAAPPAPVRSVAWAEPIVESVGVPNFHRVSDVLYRSAQPADDGFATLKAMGVKTVINLRSFHSDREECEDNGLDYVHITNKAWRPNDEDTIAFLRTVTDASRQPVLVHCQHGADRTGTMCAVYRMAVQGWSAEDAVAEMTDGGYGFHEIWDDLITYLREADVAALRSAAGIE